jgi:hypothetical protein
MLGLAAGDHLWWQQPLQHGTPAAAYGPIFGPFPTARLKRATFCDTNLLRDVKPQSYGARDPPDVSPSPSAAGKEPVALEPAEQTYELAGAAPSTEDNSFGGDGNFQWRDSTEDDFPPVDVELIRAVWKRYIANDGDSACGGTTLMCHDLLNKFVVEPDLLQLFEKVGLLDDVVYVYLPLTYLKSSQNFKLKRSSRNKGYGFVHFSSEDAATKFAQLIRQVDLVGTGRGVKQMYTTPAKFQGVGANLVELLDLNNVQWRPKQGCFYVRLESGGPLNCLGISPMRSFVLEEQKLCAN